MSDTVDISCLHTLNSEQEQKKKQAQKQEKAKQEGDKVTEETSADKPETASEVAAAEGTEAAGDAG